MTNVMKDMETWGTAPGNAIRSIGAVMFDPYETGHGAEFYRNVDLRSQLDVGLTQDPNTIRWWAGQSAAANKVLEADQRPLREVISDFHSWVKVNRGVFVWSQGAGFDIVLWEALCRACSCLVPWKFWDARDTRTAYDMGRIDVRKIKRVGVHHNALDDSKHQVKCVQAAYANVHGRKA